MGGKVDSPDTSALTAAAEQANAAMQQQASLVNTTAANEYASNQAFAQPIATTQAGMMNTSAGAAQQGYNQSQAYYDQFNKYNQAGLAYLDNAMKYNDAAYREQLARQAAADKGNQMLKDAYGLGLPLTQASAQAMNSANQATNAATNAGTNAYTVYAQPGQSYVSNLYTGGQIMDMGYDSLLAGYGGALDAEQAAYNAQMALLGDIYQGTTSMVKPR